MSDSELLCVRCARSQRTCCQTREIYVTPGDAARIAAFTGRTDFFGFAPTEDPSYLDQDDDPTWRDCVFREDQTRRILQRQPSGDCTFLGPQGCSLPLETRPLVCRLYPFDYDESGILDDLAEGCPLHLLRPGLGLLDELHMDRQQAEQWHAQLYQEVRQEPHARLPTLSVVTHSALAPSSNSPSTDS